MRYVCKNCGYIYTESWYDSGERCLDCHESPGLTKRTTAEAIALAGAIRGNRQ